MKCFPSLKEPAQKTNRKCNRDGETGTLLFRNHSISQLWDCDFEDILHLMVWEKLPSTTQKDALRKRLVDAMLNIPDEVVDVIQAFP